MRKLANLVRDENPLLLRPDLSVQDAAKRMGDTRAGAAVVVAANGELKGIFTRGDAIRRVLAESRDPATTTLREVMTAELRTIQPTTNFIEALRVMQDRGCRHLPVVDAEGKVVGLICRGDFRGRELDALKNRISGRSFDVPKLRRRALIPARARVMRFPSNDDLPSSIRQHLPVYAQDIFRAAFNSAWARYGASDPIHRQEIAHRVAWGAIKRQYRKVDGEWVRKTST